MTNEVSKKSIIGFALIVAAMIGSLLYGFFLIKKSEPDNCWSHYTTENEAIMHCEGENK